MISKKFRLFPLLALPLATYTNISHAECARDDIEFYLGKGFTPEQITNLCKPSATKPTADKPAIEEAPQEISNSTPNTEQEVTGNKDERFLKEAINGRNVSLSDDSLQYTLKTCYNYGEEDQYGFAPKACPVVKFVIALEGLEVIQAGKKYIFFGGSEVTVKSTITREITGSLEEYKAEEQQQIQEYLESGDQTIIPIRDDIALTDVKHVLLQLSR